MIRARRIEQKVKRYVLIWLAKLRRRRLNATFIAITGSSAKSTTTALISHILSGMAPVHTQVKSNLFKAHVKTLRSASNSHRYIVCEVASEGPGTLKPTIDLIKPSVGIVTIVGLEHKRSFRDYDSVAEEKALLVEALPENGLAILNFDDNRVASMAPRTKARVVTFGHSGGDYIVSNVRSPKPGELTLSIAYGGATINLTTHFTGNHNSLAVAAAFACAHQLGVPPSIIREHVACFEPLFGRCSVHYIQDGPVFIADTCKAPYYSIYYPINMMAQFDAPRKRIVIGHISDANSTELRFRDIYKACSRVAHQVIFVGDHAHRSKASSKDISEGRFVGKRSVEEAASFIKATAIPGEIILLKSSPGLHLERVLLNFETEVRCWTQRCKTRRQCVECGLYNEPFAEHKEMERHERSNPSSARF